MLSRCIIRNIVRSSIALSAIAIFSSAYAVADGLPRALPPQPLADALDSFAQASGLQVIYRAELANGLNSKGADAGLSAEQALRALLSGTGLTYTFVNARMVAIRSEADAGAGTRSNLTQSSHAPAVPAEPKRWWDRFRLAQADSGSTVDTRSAAASDSNESTSALKVEEIVVTAQKRLERLIDTPLSVSVLSSDLLGKIGAVQFRDFASSVPGLSFTTEGAGYGQIALRGVTTGNLDVSPTVGVYVDEVPYGSSTSFAQGARATLDVGLFDLDHIEVLRGPQGTLYGASAMGGLIKYVPKMPDATRFSGDVQTGLSGTQDGGISYNAAAAVNLPLVADRLALRASGFESHDGGFIDNVTLGRRDVNSADVYGGRLDLLATPSDSISLRIGAFLQNISRDGQGTADFRVTGQPQTDSLEQQRLFEEPYDQQFRLVSGTLTWETDGATLTSISSYQTSRIDMLWDFSRSYAALLTSIGFPVSAVGLTQNVATDKLTQEIRLASTSGGKLDWLVGTFYTNERSQLAQGFELRDLNGLPRPNDVFTLSSPSRYEEYAGFGDLTWHISEKADVTGGIRYSSNKARFRQDQTGVFGPSTPTRESDEDVFNYLANARYKLGEHATGYLRFATGYRPGGPNFVSRDPVTGLPAGPETFDADRLKSYEGGLKLESADRNYTMDFALYFIDWSNVQVSGTRGGFTIKLNAPGGATVQGAELSLSARPVSGFVVSSALAYQDAKLSQTDSDLKAVKDARLPNVPRFTASLNADYSLSIGTFQPTLGTTVSHVTDRYAAFDTRSFLPTAAAPAYLPEYTSVDVRMGFAVGPVEAQLYVRNLTDERGRLSSPRRVGLDEVAILQPRTYGITAATHF
jgi:outer membrane receptor protein involved in Fe transport